MRLNCAVPFCKCSRGDRKNDPIAQYNIFICRKHWDVIPKKMRRAYRRKARIWKQTGRASDGRVQSRLYSRLLRYAIEKAVGL